MNGDLLFWHEKDWFSRLIQWRTAGPFNHVEIDTGNGYSYGAKWRGVDYHLLTTGIYDYPGKPPVDVSYVLRYPLQLSPQQFTDGMDWLLQQKHKPYDWVDLLLNLYVLIRPKGPLPRTPQAYTCSELVGYYLLQAHYPVEGLPTQEDDLQLFSPNDLARLLFLERTDRHDNTRQPAQPSP